MTGRFGSLIFYPLPYALQMLGRKFTALKAGRGEVHVQPRRVYWSAELLGALRGAGGVQEVLAALHDAPLAYPTAAELQPQDGGACSYRSLLEVAIMEGNEAVALWLARRLVQWAAAPSPGARAVEAGETSRACLMYTTVVRYAYWLPAGLPDGKGPERQNGFMEILMGSSLKRLLEVRAMPPLAKITIHDPARPLSQFCLLGVQTAASSALEWGMPSVLSLLLANGVLPPAYRFGDPDFVHGIVMGSDAAYEECWCAPAPFFVETTRKRRQNDDVPICVFSVHRKLMRPLWDIPPHARSDRFLQQMLALARCTRGLTGFERALQRRILESPWVSCPCSFAGFVAAQDHCMLCALQRRREDLESRRSLVFEPEE